MNGTLYVSNYKKINNGIGFKIAVTKTIPKGYLTSIDFHYPHMAPDPVLTMSYKYKRIDWEEYRFRYISNLYNQNNNSKEVIEFMRILRMLIKGNNVTLYSEEKNYSKSFVGILTDLFRDKGFDVKEI